MPDTPQTPERPQQNQRAGSGNVQIGGDNRGNIATSGGRISNINSMNQGGDPAAAATLQAIFAELMRRVEAAPEEDREVAAPIVKQMEVAAEKIQAGEATPETESFFEKRLKNLVAMAPDIGEVAVATFANPAAGVALALQKIGRKVQAELKAGRAPAEAGE